MKWTTFLLSAGLLLESVAANSDSPFYANWFKAAHSLATKQGLTTQKPPAKSLVNEGVWQSQGGFEWQSCGGPEDLVQDLQIIPSPWPPVAGAPLTIEVSARLTEPMVAGASADVAVKWNYIKFPRLSVSICDKMKEGQNGLSCPIAAGEVAIKETVSLPSLIPKGTYTVALKANNPDGKQLVCLRTAVKFDSSGFVAASREESARHFGEEDLEGGQSLFESTVSWLGERAMKLTTWRNAPIRHEF